MAVIAALPSKTYADEVAAKDRTRSSDFDAITEVQCAQEVGQSFGVCSTAVAHVGGSAAVVVTFANGFSRTLTFSNRKLLRENATMSDVSSDIEWGLSRSRYQVRVDDQRFEIPEALIIAE